MAENNYTTPKGIAVWPKVTKPDTKYKPEGEYSVNLVLDGEDALSLKGLIDTAIADNVAEEQKKVKGKKIKVYDPPYSVVLDDDNNETSQIRFKFTQKAIIKKKDGTLVNMSVTIFDAKAQVIKDVHKLNIGSGSTIKVCFQLNPWNSATLGAGVSLRLKAVKLLKVVEGGASAAAYGFEGEEEGFEYVEDETYTGVTEDTQEDDNVPF